MKKILLITILFLSTEFNQGFAENNISLNTSKLFSANHVGYFMSGGVEYLVWVYLPSTNIAKISWYDTNGWQESSPSVSGSYDPTQNPSTTVTFINANGNNTTFAGNLYW